MRLIDADKLHYIHKWFEDSGKGEVVVFAKEIDHVPVVEAIPIEWIRAWIEDNPGNHQVIWMLDAYRHPEMDWREEKENGNI